VDFEKRIAQIYNECRTTDEIELAFDELQTELKDEISDKMLNARSILLENFDESVHEKLRDNLAISLQNLNKFEKYFWRLTKFALKDYAKFDEEQCSFELPESVCKKNNMLIDYSGLYCMAVPKRGEKKSDIIIPNNAQTYRLGHPLAQAILQYYKECDLDIHEVVFNYTDASIKVSLLENLIHQSGWLRVERFSINSFEQEDSLLFSCVTDGGEEVYPEIAERLFSFPAEEKGNVNIPEKVNEYFADQLKRQKESIMKESESRNNNFFDEEMDKLNSWADDMKLSLEKEITDLDAEIKLRKSEAKKEIKLADKVKAQRAIKDMEKKRAEKRMNLYQAQDEVDDKKEKLLDNVEKMFQQKIDQHDLFTIKWTIR